MAQPMMHLLIADSIYASRKVPIQSYGDFLLGSIAPDAVHVREDYVRKIKDVSHYDFDSKSTMGYFDNFMKEFRLKRNLQKDLLKT